MVSVRLFVPAKIEIQGCVYVCEGGSDFFFYSERNTNPNEWIFFF